MNRLGDVSGLDFFGAGEVVDGATDFEDPALGAGASAQLVDGRFEKLLRANHSRKNNASTTFFMPKGRMNDSGRRFIAVRAPLA